MTRYTPAQIEALTNHDGLRPTPPFKSETEERQYYSHYLTRYLWRYLTPADWRAIDRILDQLRIPDKVRRATKFLLPRHLS